MKTCALVVTSSLLIAAVSHAGSKQRPAPPPLAAPPAVVEVVDGTPRPFSGERVLTPTARPTGRAADLSLAPPVVNSLQTVVDEAGMASPLGGDDVMVVAPGPYYNAWLQVGGDGTLFVAVDDRFQVNIYRSTDGGETWPLWSTFDPAGGWEVHDFLIAEGIVDRAFVAFRAFDAFDDVHVAYADLNSGAPSWTVVPVLADYPVQHGKSIDLATDAIDYSSYFIYLAAQSDDSDGDDIWFARSINQGTSFEAGYRVASKTGGGRR